VFTDIGAGLTGVEYAAVAWGDYDNDGDSTSSWQAMQERSGYGAVPNNGDGTFTDIGASLVGVMRPSLAWGDYDNDGDLDLLITGDNSSGRGGEGCTGTTVAACLPTSARPARRQLRLRGVGDYDNDGDLEHPDHRVDRSSTTLSTIYRNDGGGVFTNTNENLLGVGNSAVAWGDFDNDGRLDVCSSAATGPPPTTRSLYRSSVANAKRGAGRADGPLRVGGTNQATLNWTAPADAQTPAPASATTSASARRRRHRQGLADGRARHRFSRIVRPGTQGTSAVIKGCPPAPTTGACRPSTARSPDRPSQTEVRSRCVATRSTRPARGRRGGGSGSVSVTTQAGCSWTAVQQQRLDPRDGRPGGTGTGSFGYLVDANTGPSRSGTITIGGQRSR